MRLFLLQNFFKKVSYVVVCYLKKFTASEKFPTDAVLICDVMFIAVSTFDTHHFFLSSGNNDTQADSHSLNETFGPIARVGGHYLDNEIYK